MTAGGHKEIQLTKGFMALVDARDFDWLTQWKWCVNNGKYVVRRARTSEQSAGYFVHMHRAILCAPPGLFVDHIDGNPLNNTRGNLRLCSLAQNNQNRAAMGAHKLKGAYRERGGWISTITVNAKRFYLGRFATIEEAARAYDAAALIHHGEFARLNFPEAA